MAAPTAKRITRDSYCGSRRLGVPITGVLASGLLHTLVLAPVFLGGSRTIPQPYQPGSQPEADQSSLTMVLIDDAAANNPAAAEDHLSILALAPSALRTTVNVEPPSLPSVSAPSEDTNDEATADQREYSLMVGRYTGQITARIERAWTRPRTPVAEGLFACQVRITQDDRGGVRGVDLVACNGDTHWKASLVEAIETASPLPAPPDPKVFARVVTLELRSLPYVAGANADEFER